MTDLLELLANGAAVSEILADYPYLEAEDIPAALAYASARINHPILSAVAYIAPRITAEPDKLGGKPCIRGLRIRVADVLELLASGMSEEEILADYPYLEREDFAAALEYAAGEVNHPVLAVE